MDVSQQNSGYLFCRKLFHAFSFKRCSFFVLLFVMLPVVVLGVAKLIVIFTLKPQAPRFFSLQDVCLDSYKLDTYSNSTLFISSVITLTLNATNPNKFGIWYSPSHLDAFHDGLPIGTIRVPGFFQLSHSSNVTVETRVLFLCVNVSQIVTEATLQNHSRKNMLQMKIEGDVGAHLYIFHMILIKIKAALECDIDIDYKEFTMKNEVYTIGGLKNHLTNFHTPDQCRRLPPSTICCLPFLPLSAPLVPKSWIRQWATRPTSVSLLILFFLYVLVLLISPCSGSKFRNKHDVPFFIFGDSFLDAGNNNYINTTTLDQANFWPYGETYFKFPTGRFSDGRLMSDFIAEYAHLPLVPPFLQPGLRHYYGGVNFASSGAGALVETFQGSVIDLKTQLRNYKKVETWFKHRLGNVEAKMTLSRAVYLFNIGTNDYISPYLTNSPTPYSKSQHVGMVVGNLTSVIKEIYAAGGRKFGFINLPTLGCLPGIRIIKPEKNDSCLKEVSSLAKLHNQALSKLLTQLGHNLESFKYSLYDLNRNLRLRMRHPSRYGFKEGKTACCGTGQFRGVFSCGGKRIVKEYELCDNPNEHVFWDSFHLTEQVYKQLAQEMWSGGVHDTKAKGLHNLKDLFQDL